MPCTIRLLKIPKPSMGFYDFEDFERLVEAARRAGPVPHLIVLLGGQAGLRCGEMIALEWSDIDLDKRQLCVQRSDWRGLVNAPKGGTAAVCAADHPSHGGAAGPPESETWIHFGHAHAMR